MMTPCPLQNGYLIVTLWRDGKQTSPLVHRLVLSAFESEPTPGQEARHLNGDQTDNRAANLRWGTHSENQLDQVEHGTHCHASLTHCPSGHPYSDENTYVYPNGRHRACRICRRENARRWREQNPERWRELSRRASRRHDEKRKAA